MTQTQRSEPDDYWRNPSFARRYVINNVRGPVENVGFREYDALTFLIQAQGVQYLTQRPASILDVGCGHCVRGARLGNYFECPITGLDYSKPMLEQATAIMSKLPEDKRATLVESSVEKMPFDDNQFDVAVSYGLLMSLKTLDKAADEIMRVVKYGLITIEETDTVMSEQAYRVFDEVRTKRFPGRIYWHDYLKAFGKNAGVVFTPIIAPDSWDAGEPPAYARYIVVKAVQGS